MNCERARESLLELMGEPIDTFPVDLRIHLESCTTCREELAALQETWALFGGIEEEPSSERMRARFRAMLDGEPSRARAQTAVTRPAPGGRLFWWAPRPVFQAVLLTVVLLAGVLIGTWIGAGRGSRDEIEALRAEMRSMTRAVTMSLLQHQSASERLRAVSYCEATPPDEELIQILLRVVRDDPSANVRLAALDVLASMPVRPDVRIGLIESLPHQASPSVTAAMASLLLEMDGPDAVKAVRAAAGDDRLPVSVRQYLLGLLTERGKAAGAGT